MFAEDRGVDLSSLRRRVPGLSPFSYAPWSCDFSPGTDLDKSTVARDDKVGESSIFLLLTGKH